MSELAGGFCKDDRVSVQGAGMGTVQGLPAVRGAAKVSLSVLLDSGQVSDVRATHVTLAAASPTRTGPSGNGNVAPSAAGSAGTSAGSTAMSQLSKLEEALDKIETDVLTVQNDFSGKKLGAGPAHSQLAQIESRANSLQSELDDIHSKELTTGKELVKTRKKQLLDRLTSIFSGMDLIFKAFSDAQDRAAAVQDRAASSPAVASSGPDPRAVSFDDPRTQGRLVGVIGFYYPGRSQPCDDLCGCGFLGNFWDLGADRMQLRAPNFPNQKVSFRNSEAAFQALKFWTQAELFKDLSGDDSFGLKKRFAGKEDLSYGGYGSNWAGMMAVLKAKFSKRSLQTILLQTDDAFLLEHNSVAGRDKIWSDNCIGDGSNWLGLQLMLIRDELSGKRGWTDYINSHIDSRTGKPVGRGEWQGTVQKACQALNKTLANTSRGGYAGHVAAGCPRIESSVQTSIRR